MPPLPVPGSLIADKYRVEALLGQGGMGAVFRARHELMDKPVALKWMRPTLADETVTRDRFIREARAMARVRHPNVIDVYDVGVHQGALFLVMELLHGESFESVLERGGMPIPRALRLLIESMRGTAAAHRHNIIHRDIKPENIFVVYDEHHPEGQAKVLDFGVSKLLDDATRGLKISSTGAAMGTPVYMSFEQMNGVADLDVRADVYSFGVLLYRTLTGVLPFDAETFASLVATVLQQQHKPPKQLRPELPSSVSAVVMKAMAFDRADRYSTLSDLIDALTLLASTEGFLGQMTSPSGGPPLITPKVGSSPQGNFDAASSTPPVNLPARESAKDDTANYKAPRAWQGLSARLAMSLMVALILAAVYWTTRTPVAMYPASAASVAAPPQTIPNRPADSVDIVPPAPPSSTLNAETMRLEPTTAPAVPNPDSTPHAASSKAATPSQRVPRARLQPVAAPSAPPQVQQVPVELVAPKTPSTPNPRTATGVRSGVLQSDRL